MLKNKIQKKDAKILVLKVVVTVLVFWLADFLMHFTGVGETNYYYLSKFGNAILFAAIFFLVFDFQEHWKKIVYSLAFGTWISAYYLLSSYSGLVQFFFGVYARNIPPAFVIGSLVLTPYLWWLFHGLIFFIGLELAGLIRRQK
ncbi:hypothetical protein J4474_03010 [Candidatus Pacearchaeota archaeon]|nr:hypothetical protein [Candidatus Pacearchaeota archaeon]